jgi:Uri superfamily endonuclease
MDQIPAESGSYMLLARLREEASVRVGALGVCNFMPGFYIYCGSACGPGGLRARINHHLQPSQKPSWHFDFLKPELIIDAAWFISTEDPLECSFMDSLCRLPQAKLPVRFFGSRDCRSGCYAHLVSFPLNEDINQVFQLIRIDFEGLNASPVVQIC